MTIRYSPVLDSVGVLPKEDLSSLAESLIANLRRELKERWKEDEM